MNPPRRTAKMPESAANRLNGVLNDSDLVCWVNAHPTGGKAVLCFPSVEEMELAVKRLSGKDDCPACGPT